MGKGEIAHYEQFLLFPQCFQKACFPGASEGVIVWEWAKTYLSYLILITQSQFLATQRKKPFENIVERGENAGNHHYLLFPQCFLPYQKQK